MNNVIAMPVNGETVRVRNLSGQVLALPFDVALATVERVDEDLVFTTPEGSVALEGFFALDTEALPSFSLEDGSLVSGEGLLTALDAEGLLTAAGPEGGALSSGGTLFDTDPGDGLDGLEALDAQGVSDALDATPAMPGFTQSGYGFSGEQNVYGDEAGTSASASVSSDTPSVADTPVVYGNATNTPEPVAAAGPSQTGQTAETAEMGAVSGSDPVSDPASGLSGETGSELPVMETTDYNMLFVVQLNTMNARLWNDKTEATADFGGYKTALGQVQGLLADFCDELQGTNAGTVSFGAVMFAGSNKNVRQIGPITFDADDPQSVADAHATLQEQFDAIMGQGFYDSGSNFEAAFEAASAYVQNNADLWGNPECENKVMFISNGQASASNFGANYDGPGKIGWLNKGSFYDDDGNALYTSNSISSAQNNIVTGDGATRVITHNEFQAAVDSFNTFVDSVNALGGSSVDVHALGVCSNYGNASVGRGLTQYQQEVLSFFDNTGTLTSYDADNAWSGKASNSSSGNVLTATGDQAEAGFVHELSLVAKQLAATVAGNEYTARGVTAADIASGDYAENDANGIYYLDGSLNASFGDGDNIVYLGAGKSSVELGAGDNYVNFVYYNGNTVTAGGGDNSLHVNGTGNKITLSMGAEEGHGNDTVTVTGDSNTINAGAGDDILYINSNGNNLTLGEGHDTVVLDFKTATASGETVFINGTNTITDFKMGEDVLDISKMIEVVSEKSAQNLDIESYLSQYAEVSLQGNDLHIILNHADQIEGHRRGTGKNGEDWSYDYKIDGGGVTAQSEVVLQDFAVHNPDASFDSDAAALQAMLTIMHG